MIPFICNYCPKYCSRKICSDVILIICRYGNRIISIKDEPISRNSVAGLQRAVVDMWISTKDNLFPSDSGCVVVGCADVVVVDVAVLSLVAAIVAVLLLPALMLLCFGLPGLAVPCFVLCYIDFILDCHIY